MDDRPVELGVELGAELGFEITPNNAKFRDGLAKILGSTGNAEAMIAEFESLVEKSDKDLGFTRY